MIARSSVVLVVAIAAGGLDGGPAAVDSGAAATTEPAVSMAPVASEAVVAFGQPLELLEGETALVEDGLRVRFASVLGDSRCPADVECVWEGNAAVAVEVATSEADQAVLMLNTNASFMTEAPYLTYVVGLVALEPYPRTDAPIGRPMRATLVVDMTTASTSPGPQPS